MFNYYVFDMTKRGAYTLIETANREYALSEGAHPDRVAFASAVSALAWLNRAAKHFEPQALLEYRSLLEEAAEKEKVFDLSFAHELAELSATGTEPEDEYNEDAPKPIVLSADASEVMRDGLKHAANHIIDELKRELPSFVDRSTDARKLVNRIDAYRLALLALAGAWETAEIDAVCRED